MWKLCRLRHIYIGANFPSHYIPEVALFVKTKINLVVINYSSRLLRSQNNGLLFTESFIAALLIKNNLFPFGAFRTLKMIIIASTKTSGGFR